MSKYDILVSILDELAAEARDNGFTQRFSKADLNQARSRAFIHLYLKVKFGLLDCAEREALVTDGPNDAGIDGYFIHHDIRTIYFLQAKFRANESNFANKKISIEEIAAMEINRVSAGESSDAEGNDYSGKIKGLIRAISEVEDISRYKYRAVLIANVGDIRPSLLQKLTDQVPAEVFDYERSYNELVFPIITGTYFTQEDLRISIDLSNKSAGTKISYEVATGLGPCEITVLYVPTIEIAKTMSRYRNSILRYNPRSYLELEGGKVNNAIRETIFSGSTNEFALLNNGITMVSDETNINEKIGQRNKAQLSVKNPQIINGGQTAYTLSRILEDHPDDPAIFDNKEVLLKVITIIDDRNSSITRRELIDRISTATNQQTAVTNADRHSSDEGFGALQTHLFQAYGVLFERKRGEFEDGIRAGYIKRDDVLERNLFFRIFLAANGEPDKALEKRLFLRFEKPQSIISNQLALDRFFLGYRYDRTRPSRTNSRQKSQEHCVKIFAFVHKYFESEELRSASKPELLVDRFQVSWEDFLTRIAETEVHYITHFVDRNTGERRPTFAYDRWIKSLRIKDDILRYFS